MEFGKRQQTGRKLFRHDLPPWVDPDAADFFLTINCQHRGTNQLCLPSVAEALLQSARFYHEQRKWLPFMFLLMPDHLHMIVAFNREHDLEKTVSAWKRYTSRQHGIVWQRGFFEHRLRRDESWEEKAKYILHNPVRAGLIQDGEKWPYELEPEQFVR